jgi:hypothetical protein
VIVFTLYKGFFKSPESVRTYLAGCVAHDPSVSKYRVAIKANDGHFEWHEFLAQPPFAHLGPEGFDPNRTMEPK